VYYVKKPIKRVKESKRKGNTYIAKEESINSKKKAKGKEIQR
jgi:hypothetical protein